MKTCLFKQISCGFQSENKLGLSWSLWHHKNILENLIRCAVYREIEQLFMHFLLWYKLIKLLICESLTKFQHFFSQCFANMLDKRMQAFSTGGDWVGRGWTGGWKAQTTSMVTPIRWKISFSTSRSVKGWVAGIWGAFWNDLKAGVLPAEFG